jgi:hypothetical protein
MDPTPDAHFNAYVTVTDDAGVNHAYTPGDPIPVWAFPLIGGHVVAHKRDGSSPLIPEYIVEDFDPPGHHDNSVELKAPPTSGPGSDRRSWADFATRVGVPVTAAMSRKDIIEFMQRRGLLPG